MEVQDWGTQYLSNIHHHIKISQGIGEEKSNRKSLQIVPGSENNPQSMEKGPAFSPQVLLNVPPKPSHKANPNLSRG